MTPVDHFLWWLGFICLLVTATAALVWAADWLLAPQPSQWARDAARERGEQE